MSGGLARTACAIVLTAGLTGYGSEAAEIRVSSQSTLDQALAVANPGDEIVIEDGSYRDLNMEVDRSGTAVAPIVLRAQTAGKVILGGSSRLRLIGDHVTIRGFCFRDGQASGEIWQLAGSHQRITECALIDYKDGGRKWIRISGGKRNRLDHNFIAGKTERDVTLQIDVAESANLNHHQVDHNYFGPRSRGSGNGWETIRNGYSHQQNNPAHNLFEFNLFHQCDGENEIISSKCSHNTYRCNTFRDCGGELTLRHGKHNLVQGNFFFGENKRGSAGIRIIGEGHRVVNNYVDNARGIGIHIYEGQDDAKATGYQAANDVLVAFNSVVNCGGEGIRVRDTSRIPRRIVIANNLLVGNARAIGELTNSQLAESYSLAGNLAFGNKEDSPLPEAALRTLDPLLVRGPLGVLRPSSKSPVIGAAADFVDLGFAIDTDFDGQPREGRKDVGADQIGPSAELQRRPLDLRDIGSLIGPSWMTAGDVR